MELYSIGFTKKSASEFFSAISSKKIEMLVDIRLNNKSQLAGFTKGDDLSFFLGRICNCAYKHCDDFAPTKEILDNYKKKLISWEDYEKQYRELIAKRNGCEKFINRFSMYDKVVVLCSEPTANQCHRRLLAEMLCEENPSLTIKHI